MHALRSSKGRVARGLTVLGAAGVLAGLSACGSSSSSTGATRTANNAAATSAANPAVAAARAAVARYSQWPPPIQLPAVGKPIPKQVNLIFLSVATPSQQPINSGVAAAGKALGWNVKIISPPETPEGYVSALQSIVQQKPTAVLFFSPFPLTSFQSELQQLKKEGVPVITGGAANYPVGGSSPVLADTSGANIFGPLAKLMAQVIVAQSGGKPDAAWVVDPSIPAWHIMTSDFKAEIQAAGGTFNEIDVPLTSIGKDAPNTIVGYLQAHPGVKYVSFVVGAYDLGLQQALQAAGLAGKVQLSDTDATPQDVAEIKSGQLADSVAIETESDGWRLVDLMARHLAGAPLPYTHVPSLFLVVNKSNLSLASNISAFPADTSSFLKAWGVS